MLRIGLTGGIASGKSTVSGLFAGLGAEIIDTDDIAHELVAPGSPALAAIIDAFGPDVITAEGALDRPRMRRIVFADAGARGRLEAILHPAIRERALDRASRSDAPYVILVVPLLFESGFDRLVDRTLTTDCPEALQIERIVDRDEVSRDEAAAVVSAQLDRDARLARADDVIDTGTGLDATRARVDELHELYLTRARNCSMAEGRAE